MVSSPPVMIMKEKMKGTLFLLAATIIWGFAFVAQSVGMDLIGPWTFQAVRSALAVLTLILCTFLMDKGSVKAFTTKWQSKSLWKAGCLCGCALFVAASLQQIGLVYTNAGKAGFITTMYIVLVPVLGLFLGKQIPKIALVSVGLAVVGLYLLSCAGGISNINKGDLYLMGCALAFAVQIQCVDHLSAGQDCLRMNCIQCLTVSVISIPFALITETVVWEHLLAAAVPLLFSGCLSMGIAYSCQILGQRYVEPTTASLIMSLESVFAVIGGWWLLHERLTPAEWLGCALVFTAVLLLQLPNKKSA